MPNRQPNRVSSTYIVPYAVAEDFAVNFDYVDDVPWEKSPAFFSSNGQEYLAAFSITLNRKPSDEEKIVFSDDRWDFNPYIKHVNSSANFASFSKLDTDLADKLKFFLLYEVSGKNKISTACKHVNMVRSVLIEIFKTTNHKDVRFVTFEDIRDCIRGRDLSLSSATNTYNAFYSFFYFLENHYKMTLSADLDKIRMASIKADRDNDRIDSKIPNIPDEYFDIILNRMIRLMRDDTVDHDMRMVACSVVFLSQTGLRISDFLALKTDALRENKLPGGSLKVNSIHFFSQKPAKAHQPLPEFDSYANPLCSEAFETMKKLREESVLAQDNDFLFILNQHFKNGKKEPIPHPKERYYHVYKRTFEKYFPEEASRDWEGIGVSVLHHDTIAEKAGRREPVLLHIPRTHQFRVHLCTEYYNKGVDIKFIEQNCAHLCSQMYGYYIRPKDKRQENAEASGRVIREIVGNDATPLGGAGKGLQIKENIQQLVKESGLNVKKDMDAILDYLGDRVVIRVKPGGLCCIRTTFVSCASDAKTNSVLCAYDMCPNLMSFYFHADVSYMDFQELQESYAAMKENGHARDAERELGKMKALINNRLIPELNELEDEIERNGVDVVLDRHPSLIDVIAHRKDIRKEAEDWKAR